MNNLIKTLRRHGIHHKGVLRAIQKIPRELFVLEKYKRHAYEDTALPIQANQTISQPYVIARMTEALCESGSMHKILEIGTGSGYQTAILAQLAEQIYTVERIKELYDLAQEHLSQLNVDNVQFHHGDGYLGWPEHASYDAMMVTAAAKGIPDQLMDQLNETGRMVIPVGPQYHQALLLITKNKNKFETKTLDYVQFVPFLPGTE